MIEKYAIIQNQDPKKEWYVLKCLTYTIKKKGQLKMYIRLCSIK